MRRTLASFLIIAIFSILLVQLPAAREPELYEEIRIHNAKIENRLAGWLNRARMHADHMIISDHPKLVKLREQMALLDFTDEVKALEQLNRFINKDVTYIDDYHHFHKSDYWADPETTILEGGDCEDIALLKASVLQRFGWPAERKHLLVGLLTERGHQESHAVLLVETSTGDQLILRSITDEVVHPSDYEFIPIYAVDQHGTLIVKSRDPRHLLHSQSTAAH